MESLERGGYGGGGGRGFFAVWAVGVGALTIGEEVGDKVLAIVTGFDGEARQTRSAAAAGAVFPRAFAGSHARREKGVAAGAVLGNRRAVSGRVSWRLLSCE